MGSFFFDGQDAAAHVGDALVVGLDHLVAAAVDRVEGVLEACEYRFFGGAFEEVYGEYAKGGGAAAGDFGDGVVPADELEGVADEKDMFAGRPGAAAVVGFDLFEASRSRLLPRLLMESRGLPGPPLEI
jgi:hypothetical protein